MDTLVVRVPMFSMVSNHWSNDGVLSILCYCLNETSPQQADFRGVKKTSGDSVDLGNLSLDKRNLSLASEKDLKTCANIDTKFQQVT